MADLHRFAFQSLSGVLCAHGYWWLLVQCPVLAPANGQPMSLPVFLEGLGQERDCMAHCEQDLYSVSRGLGYVFGGRFQQGVLEQLLTGIFFLTVI